MWLRDKLRKLLGLDRDWADMYNHFHKVEMEQRQQREEIRTGLAENRMLAKEIAVHNGFLARVVNKLEPNFGRDPLSAESKAESDRIGTEALQRLAGEPAAMKRMRAEREIREKYGYTPMNGEDE